MASAPRCPGKRGRFGARQMPSAQAASCGTSPASLRCAALLAAAVLRGLPPACVQARHTSLKGSQMIGFIELSVVSCEACRCRSHKTTDVISWLLCMLSIPYTSLFHW